MTVIGIDAHKLTHTMVAVDPGGRQLAQTTVPATTPGHLAAVRWAHAEFGPDVRWAVEDSRGLTGRLERDLLDACQSVVRVPTQMMARTRASARVRGKSDPIDALAVARAALREPNLPIARHDPASRDLKLLVERRIDLIGQRTASMQRLLWRVHELDPTYQVRRGGLRCRPPREALAGMLAQQSGLVAELARAELDEVNTLTPAIDQLEKRLEERVRAVAPSLLDLYGCGVLTAARVIAETADIDRFRSEAAYACYAGLAPVPAWSGSTYGRMRSHRGGNRQLNAALHQIAMTQIKKGGPAEPYYRRRREERNEHGYAIGGVKRRIARTVYNRLRAERRAALDRIIADLTQRADEWEALVASMTTDPAAHDPPGDAVAVTTPPFGWLPPPSDDPVLNAISCVAAVMAAANDEMEAILADMQPAD